MYRSPLHTYFHRYEVRHWCFNPGLASAVGGAATAANQVLQLTQETDINANTAMGGPLYNELIAILGVDSQIAGNTGPGGVLDNVLNLIASNTQQTYANLQSGSDLLVQVTDTNNNTGPGGQLDNDLQTIITNTGNTGAIYNILSTISTTLTGIKSQTDKLTFHAGNALFITLT